MKKDTEKMKSSPSYCDRYMILILLSIVLFSGLSFILFFTDLYNILIMRGLVISNTSRLYGSWKDPPVSPLVCVYVFNYTNSHQVLKSYANKLEVKQVGPYCYLETTHKVNIEFHDNGTVSYNDNRTHTFVPEKSNGNQKDILIIPNVPLLSALAIGRNLNPLARLGFYTLLGSNEVFSRVKAHEFLFGYDNNIVTIGNIIASYTGRKVQYDKFGILAKRAGLSKERLTVWTGEYDTEQTSQVVNSNGISNMDVWNTAECNAVTGSDGSRFPRTKVSNKLPVTIFSRDSCRSLPLVFNNEGKFQKEIPTHRYTIDPNYFKSKESENSCYCTVGSECLYDGVFDLSACADGAPILLSQPHFLYGDPKLIDNVIGLDPNPEKHDFFLDVHSTYGLTLGTISRIQINVQVKKPEQTFFMKELPNHIILPIVWMEIISQDMPQHMFNLVYHATFSIQYLKHFLTCMSLVFFIIASVCFVRRTTSWLTHLYSL